MKNVLVFVFVLVGFVGNSQDRITEDSLKRWYLTNKLAIEKEFIHMIDTARDHIKTRKVYMFHELDGYSQSEFREIRKKSREKGLHSNFERKKYLTIFGREINYGKIIYVTAGKEYRVPHLKYDSTLSLAAKHHSIYLNKVGFGHISHTEDAKFVKNYEVLEDHWDRIKKYDKRKLYFFGECLTVTGSNVDLNISIFYHELGELSIEAMAKYHFKQFRDSKPHWDIFMIQEDVDFMGLSLEIDFEKNMLSLVTMLASEKETYDKYNGPFIDGRLLGL